MARLGKKPVPIPAGVTVEVKDGMVAVSGKRGSVRYPVYPGLSAAVENGALVVRNTIPMEEKKEYGTADAYQGLLRTLVLNAVAGMTTDFEKILEIHGVGFKAEVKGNQLTLSLGKTHPIVVPVPKGVAVEVVKNTILYIRGGDRQAVGDLASAVRDVKPPEPYKQTGIRYRGEYVRQKVGKTAVGVTK